MKFSGTIFLTVFVLCAGAAKLADRTYACPSHLAHITLNSYNLSDFARTRFTNLADAHAGIRLKPIHLLSLAHEEIHALKKAVVKKDTQGYTLSLTLHTPLALVNNELVLTSNGCYVEKKYFQTAVLTNLFAYDVPQRLRHGQSALDQVSFIRACSRDVVQEYALSWMNSFRIELTDKQDPAMCMIIAHDTVLSPELRKAYQEVKQEIKNSSANKKGRVWQIDVRFKDQILVC